MLINCWITLFKNLRFSFKQTSKTELKSATGLVFYCIVYKLEQHRALNSPKEKREKIIDSAFGVEDVLTIQRILKNHTQRFELKPKRLSIKDCMIKPYNDALA